LPAPIPFSGWLTSVLSSFDIVLILSITLLALLGLLENAKLRRDRSRIPIRIHVNGTRGKSSVTRLIAAGLRKGGIKTIAKTTGTYPRIILEDGDEIPIQRRGRPNIKEQMGAIRMARKKGAQALVLECNAIQPEFQWVSEHRMMRATIGVLTNVRRDHTDAMGKSLEEIARCLSNTIPAGATLVIHRDRFSPFFGKKAAILKTTVIQAEDESPGMEPGGGSFLFPENMALSLKVCELCGVERETAYQGMMEADPDPGALETIDFEYQGRSLRFVNAFSANDPDSVDQILSRLADEKVLAGEVHLLLSNRRDRVLRAMGFAEFIATGKGFGRVFIAGDLGRFVYRRALGHGADRKRLFLLHSTKPEEILHDVFRSSEKGPLCLVGIGNFGGLGEKIVTYLKEKKR
jgi:gamma-polyglutamate synthase